MALGYAANRAVPILAVLHRSPLQRQSVEQQKSADCRCADVTDEFEGFCRLHRADDAGEWGENAHHGASRFLCLGVFRKQAVVAGRVFFPGIEHRKLAAKADRRTGD